MNMGHYGRYQVAILGFGIEGQDSARYFLGQGSTVTVFDRNKKEKIVTSEWKDKPIEWVTGADYLQNGIKGFDFVVRSPGFYRYMPEIVEAEKNGAKVISNTILFFEESEANIIGVTGTKGKGTIARMLKLALEECGKSLLLLGNVGTPMLDRIPDADIFDWVILELSSFQLIDLPYSPPIAVITNITTDHLNWHKDREEYIHAKENLWKHQKSTDFVVFNKDDRTCQELAKTAPGEVLWFGKETEVGREDLTVAGEHNVANAKAALVAATAIGCDLGTAWQGIAKYKGAEHRLEKVAEIEGVTYINDSAATTPEATIAALRSYDAPKVLIAGGSFKGVHFNELAKEILKTNVKAVLLLGQSADEISDELKKVSYEGTVEKGFDSMEDVVRRSRELAQRRDVVLLSPACASFGSFENYQDRGDKFKDAVLAFKVP